ncbi:MAG TPA: LuxR C-terminal-related transcriptional regulator [Gaiellaceae bacterium]|nr:LuxR C-terminal-related transcriptional regulator [Gaiellaceae bacterium]
MHELLAHDAVFRTDAAGRIHDWNAAAVRLTGIVAAEAEGRRCWEVVAGRDACGGIVCHPGCSTARLARSGRPAPCPELVMRTPLGPKRLSISTIVLRSSSEALVLHPVREAQARVLPHAPTEPAPRLTPRQREILFLLVDGVRVAQIAARLTISETTVRNHVRAILLELGAHSQLEAVARARTLALVPDEHAA